MLGHVVKLWVNSVEGRNSRCPIRTHAWSFSYDLLRLLRLPENWNIFPMPSGRTADTTV